MNSISCYFFLFFHSFLVFLSATSFKPPLEWNEIDWSPAKKVLEDGIQNGAMPGCVAAIGSKQGILWLDALGSFTYGAIPPQNEFNPPMTVDTLFDLASCTKVTGATSAIAQFYQRGDLHLDTKIVDILGEAFGKNGKESITVLNCLLHNAGYPPDPTPNYWNPEFGCPETKHDHPQENFSCLEKIYQSLLDQTLDRPVGSKYVYSDLSYITLQFVVGHIARTKGYITEKDLIPSCQELSPSPARDSCYFEAYVRKYVFEFLGMHNTMFLPPQSVWKNAAPCENDTTYLHRVIQGQVSDGNAYALGGIAGHAGLFSNVHDLFHLMHRLMFASDNDNFLNKTTVKLFTTEYNHTQSSRALGWNTNDPGVFDYGWNLLCGKMSAKTFTHIGFTGTQLCGDPERELITVLLTNRVYPSSENYKIENVRRDFNTAVVKVFDHFMNKSQ